MKHRFGMISCIWGDERLIKLNRGFRQLPQGKAYEYMLDDVRNGVERGERIDTFYCYGDNNAEFLLSCGIKPVLLHRDPWPLPKNRPDFGPGSKGFIIHGHCHYALKAWAIQHALHNDYDSIFWRDVRLVQVGEVTDRWMYSLLGGHHFRASLSWQNNWSWGARWRRINYGRTIRGITKTDDEHSKLLPSAAAMYFRGTKFIDHACQLYKRYCWYTEQQVFALTLDFENGGQWLGQEAYLKKYNMPGYYYATLLGPPPAEKTIWQVGPRKHT